MVTKILNAIKICIIPLVMSIFITFFANIKPFSNFYFKTFYIFFNLVVIYIAYKLFLLNKNISYKILLVFIYLLNFAIILYKLFTFYNIMEYLTSIIFIKNLILNSGSKGVIIFVLIQILEIVCLPIPSIIIIFVGTLIYGSFICFILCTIGVVIGSSIAFFIGNKLGFKFISWFIGAKKTNKYSQIINKNGKGILTIAFLFPFFPDDVLCLIAGISSMKYREFLKITLLTKPLGIFIMCFFGSSFSIPFSGWGIAVWVLIIICILISLVSIILNRKKIFKLFRV